MNHFIEEFLVLDYEKIEQNILRYYQQNEKYYDKEDALSALTNYQSQKIVLKDESEFSAEKAIERAIQICKYEPEFNYDDTTGMIQIWDYSEEYAQAFHREDYCKANEINLDDLIKLIEENGFSYVSLLYDAYNYMPEEKSKNEKNKGTDR